MRALAVAPSVANLARVEDIPESAGAVLVRSLAVCATDREIVSGVQGCAPPGAKRRVIGQELSGCMTVVGGVGSAAQPTQALASEPHAVKVVADFS